MKDYKSAWNKLSMADRAKYIKLGLDQGINDISYIKQQYNKYAEGGDTSLGQLTKDLVYSAMVKQSGSPTGGVHRDIGDVVKSISDYKNIVSERGTDPRFADRNLPSLYIYGNDLGQFEELPQDLATKGVEYDSYLRSVGRNPEDIKTYKGEIPSTITLPDFITPQMLQSYIESGYNRTFGRDEEKEGFFMTGEGDNVAGYLSRLAMVNDTPTVVNSDLWDFTPKEYSDRWLSGFDMFKRLLGNTQARILNKVGTPFILKDFQPIKYMDTDEYYDFDKWQGWDKHSREFDEERYILQSLNVLPQVTVTAKKHK